ncbi:MAG: hypothetical protein ACW98Y_16840 [Candidatus Thorarchaeota archaeon]
MGEETRQQLLQSYLEKMMKVTPVYIIGLLVAVEPALKDMSTSGSSDQYIAMGIVVFLGIVALFVFEGVGRKLNLTRKLQISLVSITSILYLIVGSWRAMEQDLSSLPVIGQFVPIFLAGWIFLAPLLLFRYGEEETMEETSGGAM